MGNGTKKTADSLQGDHRHRNAQARAIHPCPIPKVCTTKDPQKLNSWGKKNITIHGDLERVRQSFIAVRNCLLVKNTTKFKREYLSRINDNLLSYDVTEFQLQFYGEIAQGFHFGDQNILSWRYATWTFKDELKPSDPEYQDYKKTINLTLSWTGNDTQTEFKLKGIPSDHQADFTVDKITVNQKVKPDSEYTIDRSQCTVKFTEAPSEISNIDAFYHYEKIGPGDPKGGASLSVARWASKAESGNISDDNTYVITSGGKELLENTVVVKVNGDIKKNLQDFKLKCVDNGSSIQWRLDFLKKYAGQQIEVTFAIYADRNTNDYEEIKEEDFAATRTDALNYADYFMQVIKKANSDQYGKDFGSEINMEADIKKWIKDWKIPFPCRKLSWRNTYWVAEFRCNNPSCRFSKAPFHISYQNIGATGIAIPKCDGCLREYEISWDQIYSEQPVCKVVSLEIERDYESNTQKIMDEQDVIDPLVVYFQVNRPLPGNKEGDTEDTTLNLNKTKDMKEVAFELEKQLRRIREDNVGDKIPYICFWGYTDQTADCDFNMGLSERRGLWVMERIISFLESDNEFRITPPTGKPDYGNGTVEIKDVDIDSDGRAKERYVKCAEIAYPFGCGRGFADASSSYNPDDYRVVIIELSVLPPVIIQYMQAGFFGGRSETDS
jgi:hypothetical protein